MSSALPLPAKSRPQRATFTDKTTKNASPIGVDFNPLSLQITVSNTLEDKGQGKDKKQYVSRASAKLAMDLVFDTTDTGADVRDHTNRVRRFMFPVGEKTTERTPPTVLFEWGTFAFQGIFESYKETLDFFSHDGVPLRATVSVGMSQQEVVFSADSQNGAGAKDEPAVVPATSAEDVTRASQRAGDPGAGRLIASANGLESMRFPGGPLSIDTSVKLGAAAAFASGGAGVSVEAGVGASAEVSSGFAAGVSLGGGAGLGAGIALGTTASSASVAPRGPAFGGAASAGVSASDGAFAGLWARAPSSAGPRLDPTLFLGSPPLAGNIDDGTSFRLGGRASLESSLSLGTDVGGSRTSRVRVRFEGE